MGILYTCYWILSAVSRLESGQYVVLLLLFYIICHFDSFMFFFLNLTKFIENKTYFSTQNKHIIKIYLMLDVVKLIVKLE